MAIEKMKLVSVRCPRDQYLELASHAITEKTFHPLPASEVIKAKDIGIQYAQEPVFTQLKARMDAIDKGLNLGLSETLVTDKEVTADQVKEILDKVEFRYQKFTSTQTRTAEKEDREALDMLHKYTQNVEFHYVSVHLGRIPLEALSRVTLYNNEPFVFTELIRNKHYVWIMYVCMKEEDAHFKEMFASLYFEDVEIPKEIEHEGDVKEYCDVLMHDVYGYVAWRARTEQFERYVSIEDEDVVFSAFVPEEELEAFKKQFQGFTVTIDDNATTNYIPPTKLKNNEMVKPFESLIEMYGLPRYGSFDPTTFFAITYSLLFGIMFGDLGQGLVIALLGWYVWKKKGIGLGAVLLRIGLFSALFGVIYGSFFGDESLLHPILKPIGLPIEVGSNEMTQPLLIAAVVMGIALILISMFTNVFILLKQRRFAAAILSQNGVCGILFYGYLIVAAALLLVYNINIFGAPFLIIFIGLPFAALMLHEPILNIIHKRKMKPEEGWGGYITESFFELFETVLSFMANTLSFLRVGGFVLSHVGMMTVVLELRNLAGGGAGIFVLIFGNLLVIGLEGMIVGIQALRLEYYEMFSRYYESGGVEYKTL